MPQVLKIIGKVDVRHKLPETSLENFRQVVDFRKIHTMKKKLSIILNILSFLCSAKAIALGL